MEDDAVLTYSKAVLWDGLQLMVRHDAVREGDGKTMIEHWKLDLLQFWSRGHTMYFKIAHQFLASRSL